MLCTPSGALPLPGASLISSVLTQSQFLSCWDEMSHQHQQLQGIRRSSRSGWGTRRFGTSRLPWVSAHCRETTRCIRCSCFLRFGVQRGRR